MTNYISINIIYLRKKNHYSRKELSVKFDVSYGALSSYERCISLPPIDFIQKICKEFEVSIDDFVNKDLKKEDAPPKKQAIYINEDKENYTKEERGRFLAGQKIDSKTIDLYVKIVESKDELIAELKRRITELEVLLNQNNKN